MSFTLQGDQYNKINQFPYIVTQKVLKEYHKYLTYKENELVLEVGCGTGNVTVEVLLPYLTDINFHLVGIDIKENMIKYVKSKYSNDPRLSFRLADITEKDESILKSAFTIEELSPGFDKVFSFSVINWTNDHEQSLKNIYKLMKPGGQCLLWFVGYFAVSKIYRTIRNNKKYEQYLKDLPNYEFAFHDSKDTKSDVTDLLKKIGFTNIICDCVGKKISDDVDLSDPDIDLLKCVDPYLQALPAHLHPEYLQEMHQAYAAYFVETGNPYTRITIVASKPTQYY